MNEPLTLQVFSPIPSKKNNRVVLDNGVNIPSSEYRSWHRHHYKDFKNVARTHMPFSCPVSVSLGISFKDRHRRDLDNALTSVLDLIKDAGIIDDDDWIHVPKVGCEAVNFGEDFALVTIAPISLPWWKKVLRKVSTKVSTIFG